MSAVVNVRTGSRGWAIAALVIVLVGFVLRAAYYDRRYGHPDEVIAVQVLDYMQKTGDWDTNWAKADLDTHLQHDQYNFSAYHYALLFFYHLVTYLPGTTAWRADTGGFGVYRFFSVLLASLVVWQTISLARRAHGRTAALGAGVLAAVAVLLVQDAHYIRPEAFTTVLTLAVVALCWPTERRAGQRAVAAACLVGVLVATKVSMLLLAWLPCVPLVMRRSRVRSHWLVLGMLPGAFTAGFALGAPGALANPAAYVNGIRALTAQYTEAHPPHSHFPVRPVMDLLAGYFVATLGWMVIIAAVAGVLLLAYRKQWAALTLLAGPVVVFSGYFMTRTVFFERNVSHILPLFLVLAGLGTTEVARWLGRHVNIPGAVIATLLFGLLIARSVTFTTPLLWLGFSLRAHERRMALESTLRAQHPEAKWVETPLLTDGQLHVVEEHFKTGVAAVLLHAVDYRDEWSAHGRALLLQRFHATLITEVKAVFPDVPVCTLLTYLSADAHYYLVTGMRTANARPE